MSMTVEEIQQLYHVVFKSDAGRKVLADLRRKFGRYKFSPDTNTMYLIVGGQNVIDYVERMINGGKNG